MQFSGSRYFLENRTSFHGQTGRSEMFKVLAQGLGLDHLTYTRLVDPEGGFGDEELVTTYPSHWCDRYFEKSYAKVDPLVQSARNSVGPLDWKSLGSGADAAIGFQKDAAAHGIAGQGLVCPVKHRNGSVSLVSANVQMSDRDWKTYRKDIACDLMSLTFYVAAEIGGAPRGYRPSGLGALTKREKEVLFWAAHGKSCWETGEILQLKQRTVNDYIQKAAHKLNASSKTHAVALAMQWGILDLETEPGVDTVISQY